MKVKLSGTNGREKLILIFRTFLDAIGEELLPAQQCVDLEQRFQWLLDQKLDGEAMLKEIVNIVLAGVEVKKI
jgi:hypothetical protein